MTRVLIVGCGVTGAATAARVRKELPAITDIHLWEKAEQPGGRMITVPSPLENGCTVDLGTQYFTLTHEYIEKRQKLYDDLVEKGVLKPLQVSTIEGDKTVNARHYVAPSGSGSLVEHFLQEAELKTKTAFNLTEVNVHPDTLRVNCSTQTGVRDEFDVVVLTMPVCQILQLNGSIQDHLKSQPEVTDRLQNVTYSSRFCLGLFYKQNIDLPYSWTAKYFFDGPCIRFVSFDNKKRQQPDDSTSVLVHTSVPFSLQHVDEDLKHVQSIILHHLKGLMPQLPEPDAVIPHHWQFSQVFNGYDGPSGCVVLTQHPLIVLAGDAFSQSPGFDGCLDSAEAVDSAVIQWSQQNSEHLSK